MSTKFIAVHSTGLFFLMVSVLHKSKDTKWKSSDKEVEGHSAKEKKTNPNYQHLRGLKERGLNIFLPLKKRDLFRGGCK